MAANAPVTLLCPSQLSNLSPLGKLFTLQIVCRANDGNMKVLRVNINIFWGVDVLMLKMYGSDSDEESQSWAMHCFVIRMLLDAFPCPSYPRSNFNCVICHPLRTCDSPPPPPPAHPASTSPRQISCSHLKLSGVSFLFQSSLLELN